jgi:hypothetical protein
MCGSNCAQFSCQTTILVRQQFVEPQFVKPQFVEPQFVKFQFVKPQFVEFQFVKLLLPLVRLG